jgi:hypothetical protein
MTVPEYIAKNLPWPVIIFYSVYSAFSAFQQFSVRDFRGRSEIYRLILGYFCVATTIFGIAFLVYYGFQTVWWAPFGLFVIGLFAYIPLGFIEHFVPLWILALCSFVVIPTCAALLVLFTP